jgi:zinc transport system substrate-binding protein
MRKSPTLLGAAAGALLLAGCSGSSDESSSSTEVLASAYPFAFIAEQVGGDHVTVDSLTAPGVEPHDIELAPRQVAAVNDADLVIVLDGFQAAVDDAVAQAEVEEDRLLDVADVVTLEDTGTAHHHDEEAGHEEDEHEAEELDPHVWLDPLRMATLTGAVADRLSELDPDNADAYEANAERLIADLTALDQAYTEGLATCERRTVVTSHDAFGYLALRYDLEIVPIAGIDPAQEPSPAEQAAIADTVREEQVTTIFTEELVSPAVAESIADETGASIATLDPVEGLSEATSDEDYLSLMRANLAALKEANGCS